ncbi:helix-turn-helix domain-containing protein [uncultured Methylobacterium sp.]|uniref:helix-turn-helix domain-containing protein n=1 Tax=uncultured Methylobacterium sp. TaxID=157278 RepID=UPI0025875BF9|nr:helix-turn-helix domain-containing protein [uncultured Methylobacterium sp.]
MARKKREQTYGEWLADQLDAKGMTQLALADATGVSPQGIYLIVSGKTQNPRQATRDSIERALKAKPEKEIVETIESETNIIGMGNLEEFNPHDAGDAPEAKGIYVLYDTFDRPVYVGKAVRQTIRKRLDQHKEKFWFRDPIVTKARYIEINDMNMCSKIEMLLIRFLGSHNVLNKRGAEAFKPSDAQEDT